MNNAGFEQQRSLAAESNIFTTVTVLPKMYVWKPPITGILLRHYFSLSLQNCSYFAFNIYVNIGEICITREGDAFIRERNTSGSAVHSWKERDLVGV